MKGFVFILLTVLICGCSRDAKIASYNLSKDADMFRIKRRIVFYNGITNDYILVISGFCSIETTNAKNSVEELEVICKVSDIEYKKHFLGLSDNVTYFAEQIDAAYGQAKQYEVVFKPGVLIPSVELK